MAEIDTGKYGDVYQKVIQFDGRPSRVDEAVVSDEESEITEITTLSGYAFPEEAEGAVLRAADANGAYTAIVTAVDGNSILIDDPNFDVLDAVAAGADFVIFGNRMGSVSGGANTGGTWDGAVYNMTEDTSLIDADDAFDSYFTGWHVQVDASLPVYFEILDADGDEIKVSGDVTGMITTGETNFMIIHPVGVDPETGTTQEDPCVPESRYIWGGGLYLPPVAGFTTNLGVEGAQPGSNMSGQHYMWNRVYDINTGRWTTPDPAMQPWWNLQDYVANNPITRADPTGLAPVAGSQTVWNGIDLTLHNAQHNGLGAAMEVHFTVDETLYDNGYRLHHAWKSETEVECCCGDGHCFGQAGLELWKQRYDIDQHGSPSGNAALRGAEVDGVVVPECPCGVKKVTMTSMSVYYLAPLNERQLGNLSRIRDSAIYIDRSRTFADSECLGVPLGYHDRTTGPADADPWAGVSPGPSSGLLRRQPGGAGFEQAIFIYSRQVLTYNCDESPQSSYSSQFDVVVIQVGTWTHGKHVHHDSKSGDSLGE